MGKFLTQQEFIKRAISVHGNKYNYSEVHYTNSHDKVTIICPKHGKFFQAPNCHLQGKGCKKCSNKYKPTNDEFINACKIIHHDKYDYSKTFYKSNKENVIITCKKHGDFLQVARNHLHGSGCPQCRILKNSKNLTYTKKQFIQLSKIKHGNTYDYSLVVYKNCKQPVEIVCKKHGSFWQVPVDHYINGAGCPKCSRESKGEKRIRAWLEEKDICFVPQKRFDDLKDITYLYFDFFLPKQNILIEFNGEQHYTSNKFFHRENRSLEKQQYHDFLKNEYARNHNFKMLTIPYTEFNNIESILKQNTEKTNFTKLHLFTDESGKIYFQITCKYENSEKEVNNIVKAEKLFRNLLDSKNIHAHKLNQEVCYGSNNYK